MIAVIFRKITVDRVKAAGGSDESAQREAVTDSAAALGFISAIGAAGGFFIPQAFGTSLAMTGSPAGAMKVFLVFYILCVVIAWAVYGRKKRPEYQTAFSIPSRQGRDISFIRVISSLLLSEIFCL